MRLSFLFLLLAGYSAVLAGSPILEVENQLIASPAQIGSAASQLATGADGSVFMSWIETIANGPAKAFRISAFDPRQNSWRPATTVYEGTDVMLNFSSTPQIAINSDGAMVAAWYIVNPSSEEEKYPTYHALISRSDDHGATWATPIRLTTESLANEFLSLTSLVDGRFLAVWLDARGKTTGGHHGAEQSLRGRILFSETPDQLLDSRVCDCCGTSLVAFADGSALAIYRDRSEEEIRDISSVRFKDGAWSEPKTLSHDHWKIAGCPVNGPVISGSGARTAAAWYTAADEQPRVFVSTSANAGEVFLAQARVDDGKPLGYVDLVQLGDGTSVVSWVEAGATPGAALIWMRRISSDGTLSVPVRLAITTRDRACGIPRLTLLRDAGKSPLVQLLLSYTLVEGNLPHLAIRLLTLAPAQPERSPCATCPPATDRGAPLHGTIQTVDTKNGLVKVKHDDIPGVMPAMTMKFHIAPEELAAMKEGVEIFARVEQRDNGWWLFGVRTVERSGAAAKP